MEYLRVQQLNKIYDEKSENSVHALKDANLVINKGELISIQGVSGSGKSTLLNILGCVDAPTTGSYILEGNEVKFKNNNSSAEIRNKKIGFVFQQFGLILDETVEENIMYPLIFAGITGSKAKVKVRKVLADVSMLEYENKLCKKLSGGQKQRIAIARALVNEPNLILADEPTGALDSKTAEDIFNLLEGLTRIGKTVIIVTHDSVIAKKCHRKFIIIDGKIEEIGDRNKEI